MPRPSEVKGKVVDQGRHLKQRELGVSPLQQVVKESTGHREPRHFPRDDGTTSVSKARDLALPPEVAWDELLKKIQQQQAKRV